MYFCNEYEEESLLMEDFIIENNVNNKSIIKSDNGSNHQNNNSSYSLLISSEQTSLDLMDSSMNSLDLFNASNNNNNSSSSSSSKQHYNNSSSSGLGGNISLSSLHNSSSRILGNVKSNLRRTIQQPLGVLAASAPSVLSTHKRATKKPYCELDDIPSSDELQQIEDRPVAASATVSRRSSGSTSTDSFEAEFSTIIPFAFFETDSTSEKQACFYNNSVGVLNLDQSEDDLRQKTSTDKPNNKPKTRKAPITRSTSTRTTIATSLTTTTPTTPQQQRRHRRTPQQTRQQRINERVHQRFNQSMPQLTPVSRRRVVRRPHLHNGHHAATMTPNRKNTTLLPTSEQQQQQPTRQERRNGIINIPLLMDTSNTLLWDLDQQDHTIIRSSDTADHTIGISSDTLAAAEHRLTPSTLPRDRVQLDFDPEAYKTKTSTGKRRGQEKKTRKSRRSKSSPRKQK